MVFLASPFCSNHSPKSASSLALSSFIFTQTRSNSSKSLLIACSFCVSPCPPLPFHQPRFGLGDGLAFARLDGVGRPLPVPLNIQAGAAEALAGHARCPKPRQHPRPVVTCFGNPRAAVIRIPDRWFGHDLDGQSKVMEQRLLRTASFA